MKNILFKNKNLHFKDEGKGNVIVLLHGFLESLEVWDEFSNSLSNNFRVISIDLPGHGKTEIIDKVHSMDLMADCVKAVLDNLKIEQCVMIGHSMGGYVTLSFAKKYPDLLKGFALFHSHAAADSEEVKQGRERTIAIVRLNHQGYVKKFIPELFAAENVEIYKNEITQLLETAGEIKKESIIAALEGMKSRTGKLELLTSTDLPVLFIIGKKDPRFAFNKMIAEAMLPNHAETLILGNVGHMGFIEAKKETLKSVKCFAMKTFNQI